jgi:glutamate transport system permease protein
VTAPVLGDALGPSGRRRVAVATVVATAVLLLLAALAVRRLADAGQLDADQWDPFAQMAVVRFLLRGLWATVRAAVVAMAFSMAVGALMALGRLARGPVIRWLAGIYVEVFRALPLYLIILFCGIGLPRLDVGISSFWALVLGLTLYNGAVLGEIFRAGILSLDRGQSEAAYAIGLSYRQAMAIVVVPQAARRMIPAIVSQLITVLKDTSLGFVIVYPELLRQARSLGAQFGNELQSYAVVSLAFVAVNFTLSRIARRLEVRQRRRYGAGTISVTGGPEDLVAMGGPTSPP